MTVSYSEEVSNADFACFLKLLVKWRGSIYKLIWTELLLFLVLYYCIHLVYRFVLNDNEQKSFEIIVNYCNYNGSLIPTTFVLGFYVKIVMDRWWKQFQSIPWPDPLAVYVSSLLRGQDQRGRLMRRTIMRYVCLCLTMVFVMISPVVKKRLPTLEHLRDIGLLQDNELRIINDMDELFPKHRKHWMPIVWASSIITRARQESRIRDDSALQTLMEELNKFRGMASRLIHYDIISIPLVYTQVVSLAVYSYFLCGALAQQWVQRPDREGYTEAAIVYFPLFTVLEFIFYMGWLKVAEALISPFGEDDDDFNVEALIDRNLQVSYVIADEMNYEHPELFDENYWNTIFTKELRLLKYSLFHCESSKSSVESKDSGSLEIIRYKQFLDGLGSALDALIQRQDIQSEEIKELYRREKWPPDDSESEPETEPQTNAADNYVDYETTDIDDVEITVVQIAKPFEMEEVKEDEVAVGEDEGKASQGEDGEENDYGGREFPEGEDDEEIFVDGEEIEEFKSESSGIDYFELLRQERMWEREERAKRKFLEVMEMMSSNLDVENVLSQANLHSTNTNQTLEHVREALMRYAYSHPYYDADISSELSSNFGFPD